MIRKGDWLRVQMEFHNPWMTYIVFTFHCKESCWPRNCIFRECRGWNLHTWCCFLMKIKWKCEKRMENNGMWRNMCRTVYNIRHPPAHRIIWAVRVNEEFPTQRMVWQNDIWNKFSVSFDVTMWTIRYNVAYVHRQTTSGNPANWIPDSPNIIIVFARRN